MFTLFGHKWVPVRWKHGDRYTYGLMCVRTRKVYTSRVAWRIMYGN